MQVTFLPLRSEKKANSVPESYVKIFLKDKAVLFKLHRGLGEGTTIFSGRGVSLSKKGGRDTTMLKQS